MPKTILKHSAKKKIIESRLVMSNDWMSLKPWSKKGKIVPYFWLDSERRDSGVHPEYDIEVKTLFIGPFAMEFGRAVKKGDK